VTAPKSTPESAWKSALVVANPIAGKGHAKRLAEELCTELAGAGFETELRFSAAPGDISSFVRERDALHDLCVSVGGDGTLAEVLSGLRETPNFPVAPFPTGTANVLSKDLGLARTPRELVKAIREGHTMSLDVARVIGSDEIERTSFLVLGIGIDGMVIHDLQAHRSGPITKMSYLPSIVRSLTGYRRPRLKVEIDGVEVPGEFGFILVSNCVHYGGFFTLDPTRDAGDGLWEVVMLKRGDISSLLGVVARGLLGGAEGGACSIIRGSRVKVLSDEPVAFQLDGDAGAHTPVSLQVSSRPHRIVIPSPK
jgi:diacylglycerol kinase (ATP)